MHQQLKAAGVQPHGCTTLLYKQDILDSSWFKKFGLAAQLVYISYDAPLLRHSSGGSARVSMSRTTAAWARPADDRSAATTAFTINELRL